MKFARNHAVALQTKLVLVRCQGQPDAMPQSRWQRDTQRNVLEWLEAGGFSGMAPASPSRTKTAARGRRSLASQGDSNEEFQFSLIRIHDAAE
jgi:hypothetical protein